jgi:hypothetical protein
MPLTPDGLRRACPTLVHYAPRGVLRLEEGLLTAAQVLERNADDTGTVWAKFLDDPEYQPFDVEHWKTHSRFRRRAGERGCNLLVRAGNDPTRSFFLGNNYPLGDGTCIGTTLPLTENRPGDPAPTREDWFRTLNSMFWVFDARHVNPGVVTHLAAAAPGEQLSRVVIATAGLSDDFIEGRLRLASINGGGSNGGSPRGTATYKRPSEWTRPWPPREIGIIGGLSTLMCTALVTDGMLQIEDA